MESLRQRYPAAQIFETDLIQFTGEVVPSDGRSPHAVSLLLQSCSDGPRSVTVHFEAGEAAKYLRFHPSVEVELGPAEVVRVRVPVISPTYEGSYPLYFSLSVRGSRGSPLQAYTRTCILHGCRIKSWCGLRPPSRICGIFPRMPGGLPASSCAESSAA